MVRILGILLIAALPLLACQKEVQKPSAKPAAAPPAAKVQKPEAPRTAAPQAPAAAAALVPAAPEGPKVETETYIYNPEGRRDPFLSIIEASKKDREAEKKRRALRPSEAFELNELKVTAIAWDRNRYFAMIQFPDRKYLTIREGMALGPYGGKVIRIDRTSVTVREQVKNYRGELQTKDTILKLRKEEGE